MRPPVSSLRASIGCVALTLLAAASHVVAEEAASGTAPSITTLAAPRAVLEPAVDVLPHEPTIDGRLDRELDRLPVRSFSFLSKPQPTTPATVASYRLAYGAGCLYVFIDVQSDRIITRDRGHHHGDGFVMVLSTPRPGGEQSDESAQLAHHPTGDPLRPFAQMIRARDDDWPFSPLGDRNAFSATNRDGHACFEASLRWEDVPPFHPWLSESVGFNLVFVKAIGETDLSTLAVNMDPTQGHDTADL